MQSTELARCLHEKSPKGKLPGSPAQLVVWMIMKWPRAPRNSLRYLESLFFSTLWSSKPILPMIMYWREALLPAATRCTGMLGSVSVIEIEGEDMT